MSENILPQINVVIPKNCCLWLKDNPSGEDIELANFELLDTYIDESHLWRYLLKCKECGQLYFFEFYEQIDWEKGNDPQYVTFIPIGTENDAKNLAKYSQMELLKFSPRLQADWPEKADKKAIRWVK